MNFRTWLDQQHDEDDIIGDLAQDVRRDPPNGDWNELDLLIHISRRGGDGAVLSALAEAISVYQAIADSQPAM